MNPVQPFTFTCYVQGTPVPEETDVSLRYISDGTEIPRQFSTVNGSERSVVFRLDELVSGRFTCHLFNSAAVYEVDVSYYGKSHQKQNDILPCKLYVTWGRHFTCFSFSPPPPPTALQWRIRSNRTWAFFRWGPSGMLAFEPVGRPIARSQNTDKIRKQWIRGVFTSPVAPSPKV